MQWHYSFKFWIYLYSSGFDWKFTYKGIMYLPSSAFLKFGYPLIRSSGLNEWLKEWGKVIILSPQHSFHCDNMYYVLGQDVSERAKSFVISHYLFLNFYFITLERSDEWQKIFWHLYGNEIPDSKTRFMQVSLIG